MVCLTTDADMCQSQPPTLIVRLTEWPRSFVIFVDLNHGALNILNDCIARKIQGIEPSVMCNA